MLEHSLVSFNMNVPEDFLETWGALGDLACEGGGQENINQLFSAWI